MIVVRALKSLIFAILLAGTVSTAGAVTFTVSSDGPFSEQVGFNPDIFVNYPGGMISGFFDVTDFGGDGFVDSADIVAWELTSSGFSDPRLNFMISSEMLGAEAISTQFVPPVDIGGGLTAEFLDMGITGPGGTFTGIFIGFTPVREISAFFVDDVTASDPIVLGPTSSEFAVEAVPLPAAAPLFLTGLIGAGLFGWRRRQSRYL